MVAHRKRRLPAQVNPPHLHHFGALTRGFLEPHWRAWHAAWGSQPPNCPSQWTCVRSSVFVCRTLNQIGCEAAFQSGRPYGGGHLYGYFHDDEWQTHAWVLAGNWILDLTADQFGGPAVLIAAADDARYRCGVDDRTRLEPSARAMRAVDFLWTSWQRRVEDGTR